MSLFSSSLYYQINKSDLESLYEVKEKDYLQNAYTTSYVGKMKGSYVVAFFSIRIIIKLN